MLQQGVRKAIHYLDDFLIIGESYTDCHNQLEHALATCNNLGIPVSLSKLEGPATKITFLCINIDTIQGELSLPQEKLMRILQLLTRRTHRKTCRKRELLSLIGELQHAATIVRPGHIPKCLNHFVRLSSSAQADIMLWLCFMSQWNSRSFIPFDPSLRDVLMPQATGVVQHFGETTGGNSSGLALLPFGISLLKNSSPLYWKRIHGVVNGGMLK